MEGPTPVSALIHAATMVTAGVFLMTRVNPVLEVAADWAPTLIAIIGVATALFAATIAVAQNDIKRVLAYSTVSQLGYMFLAIGSGAYVAAIFHVVTHAFFKALLFLGSGSVIHGMHGEQDMRRMGALRVLMPITAITFIVGWLAIAGVPPFAGFWSKDEILLFAYAKSPVLYVVGLITALLTAYYMTRQVIMVFFGEARWKDHAAEHGAHGDLTPAREPGDDGAPARRARRPLDRRRRDPAARSPTTSTSSRSGSTRSSSSARRDIHGTWAYDNKYVLLAVAAVIAVVGIFVAGLVYHRKRIRAVEPAILEQAWYYDRGVSALHGRPGPQVLRRRQLVRPRRSSTAPSTASAGSCAAPPAGSARPRRGYVRQYASALASGVVLLLVWFVVVRGIV